MEGISPSHKMKSQGREGSTIYIDGNMTCAPHCKTSDTHQIVIDVYCDTVLTTLIPNNPSVHKSPKSLGYSIRMLDTAECLLKFGDNYLLDCETLNK